MNPPRPQHNQIRLGANDGRVKAGAWYAPLLVAQIVAQEKAEKEAAGSSSTAVWGAERAGFASSRTRARAEMRATAAAQRRADQFAEHRAHFEDGELSEGEKSAGSGISGVRRAFSRSAVDEDLR